MSLTCVCYQNHYTYNVYFKGMLSVLADIKFFKIYLNLNVFSFFSITAVCHHMFVFEQTCTDFKSLLTPTGSY